MQIFSFNFARLWTKMGNAICALLILSAMTISTAQAQDTSAADAATSADAKSGTIETLVEILKDDATREQLIELLSQVEPTQADNAQSELAASEAEPQDNSQSATAGANQDFSDILAPKSNPTSEPDESTQEDAPSISRQIAVSTLSLAERIYYGTRSFWRDLTGMRFVIETLSEEKQGRLANGAMGLIGTALITLIFGWLGQSIVPRLSVWLLQKNETHADPSNLEQTENTISPPGNEINATLELLVLTLISLGWLAITLAVGYFSSLFVFGGSGLAIEQTLFLNAYLVALAALILLDSLVHPQRLQITIFRPSLKLGQLLHTNIAGIIIFCVIGITFIVPISNSWANFATGRALRTLIVTIAALWAFWTIFRASTIMRQSVENQKTSLTIKQKTLLLLAAIYMLVAWVIGIAHPGFLVAGFGAASAQILIIFVVTATGLRLLQPMTEPAQIGMVSSPNPLPNIWKSVAELSPWIARIASVLLIMASGLFLANALWLIDIGELSQRPEVREFAVNLLVAALIVLVSAAVWLFVSALIDRRLSQELPIEGDEARKRTLLALFKNAFAIVIFIFAIMTALSQIGLDIAPLLAGAGVIGLAIGFGAQKLVQDVITGIFIQIENAINVGDVVTVTGITGGVEKLTVRSVGLRDLNGTYHIVPFSAVDTVSNSTRNFAYHVAEIGVAYKEKIPAVKDAMLEAFTLLQQSELGEFILGPLEMHGVTALADSSVNVRARIKTKPGKQWEVGRFYTEIVKQVFDDHNIEIPFPHRTMIFEPNALPAPAKPQAARRTAPSQKTESAAPSAKKTTPRRKQAETKHVPPDTDGEI